MSEITYKGLKVIEDPNNPGNPLDPMPGPAGTMIQENFLTLANTLSPDGTNISVQGTATAGSFAGDGSQLTNLPGGGNPYNQSLNTTDDVVFNSVSGDGSGLTNLPVSNPFDQLLNTTSDVTFNSVSGDGSGLTNLPSGGNPFDQSLNTTDDVTFNSVNGDGSGLTNIPVSNPFDQLLNTTDDVVFNSVSGDGSRLTNLPGGGGLPSNVGTVVQTNLHTSAISATPIYTPPSNGMYEASVYAITTQTGGGTASIRVNYVDDNGTNFVSLTLGTNVLTVSKLVSCFYAIGGNAISWSVPLVGTGSGTPNWNLYITLTQLS